MTITTISKSPLLIDKRMRFQPWKYNRYNYDKPKPGKTHGEARKNRGANGPSILMLNKT
jgi:hypothetical protein